MGQPPSDFQHGKKMTKLKIAARTNVGLARTNNEDNYQVSSNLSTTPMGWVNNELIDLDEKGALLVVADGMGGQNAGEVASEIAIKTIKDRFTPENLTEDVLRDKSSIDDFMKETITVADHRIKTTAKERPETKGMGTTIIIAWLLDGKVYMAWCGDSRGYVYNPEYGLRRLSKDHSYVQTLVDSGKLTEDEAFDFPQSNVITNCLCDADIKAVPECIKEPHTLCDNDIILLCSDGLCGMIRDREIESIIRKETDDMTVLGDSLIEGALNAGGSDNVTICLAKIVSDVAVVSHKETKEAPTSKLDNTTIIESNIQEDTPSDASSSQNNKGHKLLYMGLGALLAIAAIVAILCLTKADKQVTTEGNCVDDTTKAEALLHDTIQEPILSDTIKACATDTTQSCQDTSHTVSTETKNEKPIPQHIDTLKIDNIRPHIPLNDMDLSKLIPENQ